MADATPPPVDFKSLVASIATTAAATMGHVESLLQQTTHKSEGTTSGGGEKQADAGEAAPEEEKTASPSPEEAAEGIRHGLESSRHLIDLVAMLEEKTKGNLTSDEQQFLQTTLTELRMGYVRLAGKVQGGTGGGTSAGSG
ncbi:MAG: DUF1844 domain-containing protein [Gemmatimonadales bacterium]|nr:DUF1844 domain-containing protein [Gemmatimonadales bacterium]NIN11321.1 DUF1844 domain-containing protein [Gemmatimonadales bacterium]NIN49920.1 DUF1844 domain-containing protein [Gemmatimonadales bacterium]NIP07384.1 DUF1844 domain-containing protein [Gemmatimonadales bacterium]NIR03079.1 DUF1844 domain-containing protein [Gemmatimonadales bacterium]